MGTYPSPGLNLSTNIATLLSGCAFICLVVSMPMLFTIMNSLEAELIEARITYDEMSNIMWKDLMSEGDVLKRTARQAYRSGQEATSRSGGETNGEAGDGGVASPARPHGGPEGSSGAAAGGNAAKGKGAAGAAQKCPAGPKGPKGAPGLKGLDGEPGAPGAKGKTGLSGNAIEGEECPPCPQGPPGEPGYKGKRGARGPKGEKGPPGPPGMDGALGDQGPDGSPGLPGEAGPQGQTGPPGLDAKGTTKGPPGPKGEVGPPGMEGDEGLPGERGDDAPAGPQGPPGPMGVPGEEGAAGFPGHPGKPGRNGADAEYCICPKRKEKGYQLPEEPYKIPEEPPSESPIRAAEPATDAPTYAGTTEPADIAPPGRPSSHTRGNTARPAGTAVAPEHPAAAEASAGGEHQPGEGAPSAAVGVLVAVSESPLPAGAGNTVTKPITIVSEPQGVQVSVGDYKTKDQVPANKKKALAQALRRKLVFKS